MQFAFVSLLSTRRIGTCPRFAPLATRSALICQNTSRWPNARDGGTADVTVGTQASTSRDRFRVPLAMVWSPVPM